MPPPGGGGEVIELEYGITVYPARDEIGRCRGVWERGEKRPSPRYRDLLCLLFGTRRSLPWLWSA